MSEQFEQEKSVSYWLLSSRFVIPWDIEDSTTVHAEITYSDGKVSELIPEEDFSVDTEDGWLILNKEHAGEAIHIFEGEKQERKAHIVSKERPSHALVRESDLVPTYSRLDQIEEVVEKVLLKIESGGKTVENHIKELKSKTDLDLPIFSQLQFLNFLVKLIHGLLYSLFSLVRKR